MRFAVHQPVFMSWPGLVHKASRVDRLVILDAVQFPRGFTWVNRNRLKAATGEVWLTVPVYRKGLGLQAIDQVAVLRDARWRRKHLACIKHCYGKAPFFEEHYAFLEVLYARAFHRLLDWNLATIDHILSSFGHTRGYVLLSDLGIDALGTELIIAIGEKLGARILVAPLAARRHLDVAAIEGSGLAVEWLEYEPPVYPQLWGDFVENLSALDLLFNYGHHARYILEAAQS
jgi:hypothetical protein